MDLRSLLARSLLILVMLGGGETHAQNSPTPAAPNGWQPRKPRTAWRSQWPRTCSLLTFEDVQKVYPDRIVRPDNEFPEIDAIWPKYGVSSIGFGFGKERQEYCHYLIAAPEDLTGQRIPQVQIASVTIAHMVDSPEVARKYYDYFGPARDAYTDIAGVGDEARLTSSGLLYVRKGLVTISVRVSDSVQVVEVIPEGGDPAERRRRTIELAKLVVGRMP